MKPQRIIRPVTAFSVASTKQKRPRVKDEQHLRFIRSLCCCICGKPDPDPAHIRSASAVYGKRETGGAEKASDKWTVPLCRTHHDEQHAAGNELTWWASKGIDPFGIALALHSASGDDEIADAIIRANISRQR
jgi:Putative HNHc nuclease